MKQIVDKYSGKFNEIETSKRPGVLATIKGAVTGWRPNRNGRTYSRELWQKALDSDYVKEQVALKHFVGEADHPEERLEPIIKEMSHSMTDFEFHDETSEVWATIDILDTPNGHMLKTLLDYSGSLSFSTRGSGDVMDNGEVDPDTYQLFAIDAVLRPSYPTATVKLSESENLTKSDKQVKSLIEKYSGKKLNEMSPAGDEISNILDFIDGVKWAPSDIDDLKYLVSIYVPSKEVIEKVRKASSENEIRALIKPYYYDFMNRLGSDDYEDDYYESVDDMMFKLNNNLNETKSNKSKDKVFEYYNNLKPKTISEAIKEKKSLHENYGDNTDYSEKIEQLVDDFMKEVFAIQHVFTTSYIDVKYTDDEFEKPYEYIVRIEDNSFTKQGSRYSMEELAEYITDRIASLELKSIGEYKDMPYMIFTQNIGMPDFGDNIF